MEVILNLSGGANTPAYFVYNCASCGHELVNDNKHLVELVHPTHDGFIFKGKPINCEHVGKSFKKPTIKLESL